MRQRGAQKRPLIGGKYSDPHYFQDLANYYGSESYTPMVMGNGAVLGNINAPWYMHVFATVSIMGEGYAMGRIRLNTGKGLRNHYDTSSGYGIKNYWSNYYTPKSFSPWW